MQSDQYIPIIQLCEHYQLKTTFFAALQEEGLVEVLTVENDSCLHQDAIHHLEKIIRIHHDLNINLEGVDAVLNLLERMENMQKELVRLQNRLRLYENE